jgi:Subtilase family
VADHFFIGGRTRRENYTPPNSMGSKSNRPARDRLGHGSKIKSLLESAWALATANRKKFAVVAGNPEGFLVQFASEPEFSLELAKLDSQSKDGIQLRSVRQDGAVQLATVFIPEGRVKAFIKKFEDYLTADTKHGKPKNQPLVDSISDLRLATIESLWTDTLPWPAKTQRIWWEVWLRSDGGKELVRFNELVTKLNLVSGKRHLNFIDRTVVLVNATPSELSHSLEFLNDFAEVRMAKDCPSFFVRLSQREQAEWIRSLQDRTIPAPEGAPSVCILDTGVNRNHPLLESSLESQNLFAFRPEWGVEDRRGHGTEMAGISLYGNLTAVLADRSAVVLSHCLESVKILPNGGENPQELYGAITADAAWQTELAEPSTKRVFLLAVTAPDQRDRGRPSSWSAKIDALAAGLADSSNDCQRLFVIAAGNRTSPLGPNYFSESLSDSIHDPGQSWNALTVGAHTELIHIEEQSHDGWTPIALPGQLAPASTTSVIWQSQWPLKPELVMEGGNRALSPGQDQVDAVDSLSLLTTNFSLSQRLLTVTGDTSAAAAQAARMAALILARYPYAWPETVRAIMVHSARWLPEMMAQVGGDGRRSTQILLRCFGYGVPDLSRALESTGSSLTLISQGLIYPFEKDKTKEMIIHELPWPRDVLLSLGDVDVTMRVTLSYFIEPNPAERGWKQKHRYSSHGLRFDVKTATESVDQFRSRLNKQAREEESGVTSFSDSDRWLLGPRLRSKGSIHSDVWSGSAAELAERGFVGVYPVVGWWRERHQLNRWQQGARYSLLVSIETASTGVDLYIPINALIKSELPMEITSEQF